MRSVLVLFGPESTYILVGSRAIEVIGLEVHSLIGIDADGDIYGEILSISRTWPCTAAGRTFHFINFIDGALSAEFPSGELSSYLSMS